MGKLKTLEEVIEQIKSEIINDINAKCVPIDVSSFGELHDFVDANTYGGFCDDDGIVDALIEKYGGRDPSTEEMPDEVVKFMNDAHSAVDIWLKSGTLKLLDAIRSECFGPYEYAQLLRKYQSVKHKHNLSA